MNLTIRHMTGSLGIVPTDLETQACSGVVGTALGIAHAQSQHGHCAQVFGWNPQAPAQPFMFGDVEIHATAGWEWAKARTYDFRVIAPLLRMARRAGPATVLHAYADPHLLLAPGANVRLLHLQTPTPIDPGWAYHRLLRRAHAVICCSDFIRRQFLERVDYPKERVIVVHNGFDPCRFQRNDGNALRQEWGIPEGTSVVLFAGALVPQKGLLHLLSAAAQLRHTYDFQIVVAGSAGLWSTPDDTGEGHEGEYIRLVRQAAVGLPVRWLGAVPAGDMPGVYAVADIFVCPSNWDEPFPLVVCEATAAGKPVIASLAGGLPEIVVDGETGLLVPPGCNDAIATALATLLTNTDLANQMGRNARERSAQFTWASAATRLDDIYANLRSDLADRDVTPHSLATS
jgi:glycosyltransferase involved in cell wall biosynthesis